MYIAPPSVSWPLWEPCMEENINGAPLKIRKAKISPSRPKTHIWWGGTVGGVVFNWGAEFPALVEVKDEVSWFEKEVCLLKRIPCGILFGISNLIEGSGRGTMTAARRPPEPSASVGRTPFAGAAESESRKRACDCWGILGKTKHVSNHGEEN